MAEFIQPPAHAADSKRVLWVKLNRLLEGGGPIPPDYDPDAIAFAAATGATDVAGLSALFSGWKEMGLWDNSYLIPMPASKNYGTGSSLKVTGGLVTTESGTLVNGAVWTPDGIQCSGATAVGNHIATNIPELTTQHSIGVCFKCNGANQANGYQNPITTASSSDAGIRVTYPNPVDGLLPASWSYSSTGADTSASAVPLTAVPVGEWLIAQATFPAVSPATGGITAVDTSMKVNAQNRITSNQTNRGGRTASNNSYFFSSRTTGASERLNGIYSFAYIYDGLLTEMQQIDIRNLMMELGYLQ